MNAFLFCTTAYFLVLFIPSSSFASEFWVTFPELSSREKLRHGVDTVSDEFNSQDLLSIYDAMATKPADSEKVKSLLTMEEEAQEEALAGHFQSAAEKYGKLIVKLFETPNVFGVEKIMFATLVRRAEFADLLGNTQSHFYWKEAHAWAPNAQLPSDVFSPAVVEKFKSIGKESLARREIKITAPAESSVFIDGRVVNMKSDTWTAFAEVGTHQIAFLVPGALWQIQTLAVVSDKIPLEIKLSATAVIGGSCDTPRYQANHIPNGVRIVALFNGGSCVRVFDGKQWFSSKGSPVTEPMGQTASNRSVDSDALGGAPVEGASVQISTNKSWFSSVSKSPWFWIGAGAIVASSTYLILQAHQPEETVFVPTQK